MLTCWLTSSSLPLLSYRLGLLVVYHFLSLSGIAWNQNGRNVYPAIRLHLCRRTGACLQFPSLSQSTLGVETALSESYCCRSLVFDGGEKPRQSYFRCVFFFSLRGAKEASRRGELALITMDKATSGIREREGGVWGWRERKEGGPEGWLGVSSLSDAGFYKPLGRKWGRGHPLTCSHLPPHGLSQKQFKQLMEVGLILSPSHTAALWLTLLISD